MIIPKLDKKHGIMILNMMAVLAIVDSVTDDMCASDVERTRDVMENIMRLVYTNLNDTPKINDFQGSKQETIKERRKTRSVVSKVERAHKRAEIYESLNHGQLLPDSFQNWHFILPTTFY